MALVGFELSNVITSKALLTIQPCRQQYHQEMSSMFAMKPLLEYLAYAAFVKVIVIVGKDFYLSIIRIDIMLLTIYQS